MTIYELTQAFRRYKYFLLGGLGLLVVFVSVLTLSIDEDGIGWRGGLKYEAGFQISVVAPGTVSLSEPDSEANLSGAAAQYADLLTTREAAEAIGEMSGYVLNETVKAGAVRGSSVISGTVIGPSSDLAEAASRNAFVWLAQKIQQPLNALPPVVTTVPSTPDVNLESAFPSALSVEIDESLVAVSPDLFVLIEVGQSQPAAVPVAQRAAGTVVSAATFEASGSLIMSLETSDGTLYDILRLAPDPLPRTASAYPTLVVRFGPGSLMEIEGEVDDPEASTPRWAFEPSAITTEWVKGIPEEQPVVAEPQQLQIALLTEAPIAEQIGGRRGPLIGFAVLLVGLLLLLTSVIVADTWRRDRDEHEVWNRQPPGVMRPDGDDWVRLETLPAVDQDVLTGSGPDVVDSTLPEQ